MRCSDADTTDRHAVVGLGHQHGLTLPLLHPHPVIGGNTDLGKCPGIHSRRRHNRIGRLLQGWRPTCHRVGEIDRHIGDALQLVLHCRKRNGNPVQGVIEPRDKFGALAEHFVANRFARFVGETVEVQHIAENAQQLPCRT